MKYLVQAKNNPFRIMNQRGEVRLIGKTATVMTLEQLGDNNLMDRRLLCTPISEPVAPPEVKKTRKKKAN
jgi:hypothetical protein